MKKKIKKFHIYGERNSGTNFLRSAIDKNFKLEDNPISNKHFWNKENNLELHTDTAILVIIRNVFDWINSMYHSPYHLQPELKKPKNKLDFLNKEFWSFFDEHTSSVTKRFPSKSGLEIMKDRNLHTKERYKNIFEARYIKYNYMLELSQENKHIYFLKYEDLNEEYEKNIKLISEHYNIKLKTDCRSKYYCRGHKIKAINSYRGFTKKVARFLTKNREKIFKDDEISQHPNFNQQLENKFGY